MQPASTQVLDGDVVEHSRLFGIGPRRLGIEIDCGFSTREAAQAFFATRKPAPPYPGAKWIVGDELTWDGLRARLENLFNCGTGKLFLALDPTGREYEELTVFVVAELIDQLCGEHHEDATLGWRTYRFGSEWPGPKQESYHVSAEMLAHLGGVEATTIPLLVAAGKLPTGDLLTFDLAQPLVASWLESKTKLAGT